MLLKQIPNVLVMKSNVNCCDLIKNVKILATTAAPRSMTGARFRNHAKYIYKRFSRLLVEVAPSLYVNVYTIHTTMPKTETVFLKKPKLTQIQPVIRCVHGTAFLDRIRHCCNTRSCCHTEMFNVGRLPSN